MDAGAQESQGSTSNAPGLPAETAPANRKLSPQLRRFADAYIKLGDPTKAYLLTHRDCKSANQAKARGRKLLTDPRLLSYVSQVRSQALVSTDTSTADPDKMAWEMELRSVAFASFNAKKVPVKEKIVALRTLGESKGWLKQQQQGTGLRATFNFTVGGARRGSTGRTISVDVDTDPAGVVGAGVDLDPETRNVGVAAQQQPDIMFVGVGLPSESESESESDVRLTADRMPLSDSRMPTADNGAQSRSQVVDSTESGTKEAGKAPNTSAPGISRSSLLDDSGDPVPVDKSAKRLFDASNT